MRPPFPVWLDGAHFLNLLFLSLLARSGLQILGAFPRLYVRDDCTPGTEFIWFHRGRRSSRIVRTSLDEEVDMPSWLALPGGRNLGLGRHWHFVALLGWVLTGCTYVVLLFVTDQWRRLVPTTWAVLPQALAAAGDYAHLRFPPELPGLPYNALQQLTYFAVVFLLAPFQIATGAAMSPALTGAAPWYTRLFGGRQMARTLHFLGLLAFTAFVLVHTLMVVVHGLPQELARIVLADPAADGREAVVVAAFGLLLVVLLHVAGGHLSRREPRDAQHLLGLPLDALQAALTRRLRSRQAYPRSAISPFHWVNGRPPDSPEYAEQVARGFADWTLEVGGLVERPLRLSLDDLRALPAQSQVVRHNCIQGWSAIAEWTGVAVSELLRRAGPRPEARFAVVHAFADPKTDGEDYYETLDLEVARGPQCLLAYGMNGHPLAIEHGAPLRLRVENQLGFKMVKWVCRIDLVADYRQIGEGQGGWREDHMHYSREVAI